MVKAVKKGPQETNKENIPPASSPASITAFSKTEKNI